MDCVYLASCRSASHPEPFTTLAVCATADAAKKWLLETLDWLTYVRGLDINSCHLDDWDTVIDCDGNAYLCSAVLVDSYPFDGGPALELKIKRRYVIE